MDSYMNNKINFIQNHIKNLQHEITNLPIPWTYGVDKYGRIFFINDELRTTTWLHPITQKPVTSMIIPPLDELPLGCEKDTFYGLPYYIDHNKQINTFNIPDNNRQYTSLQQQQPQQVKFSPNTESTSLVSSSDTLTNTIKKSGFLFKLNQTGFKRWKKRYFVLNDHILDYFPDSTQSKHSGTIFLADSQTRLCPKTSATSKQSKYSFKIEWKSASTQNDSSKIISKSLELAADSYDLAVEWVALLDRAAQVNRPQLKSIIKNTSNKIREYSPSPVDRASRSNSAPISPVQLKNQHNEQPHLRNVYKAQSNYTLNTNEDNDLRMSNNKRSSSLHRTNNLNEVLANDMLSYNYNDQNQQNRVDNSRRYKSDQNLYKYNLDASHQQHQQLNNIYQTQFIKNNTQRASNSRLNANYIDKINNNNNKVIDSFYQLNKQNLEDLPRNELNILIRQLKRNLMLLNQSNERFNLLRNMYEPYLIMNSVQSRSSRNQQQQQLLHDTLSIIKDRIEKIDLKSHLIVSCINTASNYEYNHQQQQQQQQQHLSHRSMPTTTTSTSTTVTNNHNNNVNEINDLLKLFEYQIIEMQHDHELVLEDKLIVEKLIDNQLKLFKLHSNSDATNDTSLVQQFNSLNHELELLKVQLNKLNKLQMDTIAEKTKHEMTLLNQQEPKLNRPPHHEQPSIQKFKIDHYFDNQQQQQQQQFQSNNMDAIKFNSTIWKKPLKTEVSSLQNNQQDMFRSRGFIQRDVVRERRRASIGRSSNNLINTSNNTSSNDSNQHQQQQQQQSAFERLFGGSIRSDPNKRVALVRPEMRSDDVMIIDNYDTHEQIDKKLSKPEVLQIPERYFDTSDIQYQEYQQQQQQESLQLSDYEIKQREKRVHDLKKLIAAQTIDLNLSNVSNEIIDIEKEKQEREQVIINSQVNIHNNNNNNSFNKFHKCVYV